MKDDATAGRPGDKPKIPPADFRVGGDVNAPKSGGLQSLRQRNNVSNRLSGSLRELLPERRLPKGR
jgi:hypothetical protein